MAIIAPEEKLTGEDLLSIDKITTCIKVKPAVSTHNKGTIMHSKLAGAPKSLIRVMMMDNFVSATNNIVSTTLKLYH
jgi:hypothetical protein